MTFVELNSSWTATAIVACSALSALLVGLALLVRWRAVGDVVNAEMRNESDLERRSESTQIKRLSLSKSLPVRNLMSLTLSKNRSSQMSSESERSIGGGSACPV